MHGLVLNVVPLVWQSFRPMHVVRKPWPLPRCHNSNFRFKGVCPLLGKQQYKTLISPSVKNQRRAECTSWQSEINDWMVWLFTQGRKSGGFFLGEGVKQISVCARLDPRSQCLWVIPWCRAQKQGLSVTQIYADLLNLCARPVVTRVWLEVWSSS